MLPEIVVEADRGSNADEASGNTDNAAALPDAAAGEGPLNTGGATESPFGNTPPQQVPSQPTTQFESGISREDSLLGQASSASTGAYGQTDLQSRPINRPGDVLELIPGFIATQHSGTGKANQYFVRGINLDHGTDFAVRVDGIPMNLPSHGHGQGYLDVNWLIPELMQSAEYRLGPYYADIGDFSSAGAVDIQIAKELPNGIASATAGSFDYYRTLIADSGEFAGGTLLYAFETTFYNGPWTVKEDFDKLNGLLRWSHGNQDHGVSMTLFGYDSQWTATNQVPVRAVDAGIVSRFGTLDPSDGGKTSRYGINGQYWSHDRDVTTKANAYVSYYDMDLFSNFTFYLDDPVNGDQIEQVDQRWYAGMNLSQTYHRECVDHTVGFQFRNDNIHELALNRTRNRQFVSPVRNDSVDQQSYSLYYENKAILTPLLRSTIGLRGDFYRFHNRANVNTADTGTVDDTVLSPKLGIVLGPWSDSELYVNWGQSFHSNDARGVNSSTDPADPLVKSDGAEVGARTWLTPDWNSTIALWYLEIDSELLFVGDAGTTEAGPASHRGGITWTNFLRLTDWMTADVDYSHVRPRFTGGDRIPNAVENVVTTGITAQGPDSPWYGTFRLRHYGPAALSEDNSARSSTTTLANMQVGYQTRRMTMAVDIFNLFDSDDNDITYFYESQPLGLAAAEDLHFHSVEPLMARASVTWRF
ncbi:TonB-dependent receptor plug domain-containing protein [Stieleria sp. JC731]|uniref:TonB-dependent receptor n=1 Tax=Pirellulaceae TaxID=2691357 RepID=UPI001E33CC8E|nr:TonB-dependent receptor [Stieleria sp. JC731]MCC9603271.1 TonB-dependent receptor plug domain-containing protein [Stieleria sp. JC731]